MVSRGLRAGEGAWETAGTTESAAVEKFGNFMETDPGSALPGHVRPGLSRRGRGGGSTGASVPRALGLVDAQGNPGLRASPSPVA